MEDNFDTRMIGDREYFVVPEEHWYGDVGVSLRDMRHFNVLVEYDTEYDTEYDRDLGFGEFVLELGYGQSDPCVEGRVYW